MIENSEKEVKVINNAQWKERHQFILSANDNIICQRYFKVHGFNPNSLRSVDLYEVIREVVDIIKNDLASKSRVYMGIAMKNRSKLTGFYSSDDLTYNDAFLICNDAIDGKVELSNGVVLDKSYINYNNVNTEEEDNAPFTFKFSYIFDDKVIYEEVWDGTVYPKYVRNSVDLSNSNSLYKNADPMRMSFSQQMTKYLTEGRTDLIYRIIKMLSGVLSNDVDENGESVEKEYTFDFEYGNKKYYCDTYPHEYVKGWAIAVRQKTIDYRMKKF